MVGCMRNGRRVVGGAAKTSQKTTFGSTNARRVVESLQTHRVRLLNHFCSSVATTFSDIFFIFYRQVMSAPFARRPTVTGYSSDGDTDEE